MDVVEARRILKVFGENLQRLKHELKIEFPPSMAPITTRFFFDQLECAMENIENREYDLEQFESKTASLDLESLIDEVYNKFLESKRRKEEVEKIRVQNVIKDRVEGFTRRLREAIPDNVYNALNVEVFCKSENSTVGAYIDYRQARILITFGPYAGGEWGIQVEEGKVSEYMEHAKSEKLVDLLLLKMGFIRERATNVNGSR